MSNKMIRWYDRAHEELFLQAKPEFYKTVADLVVGFYLDVSCGLGQSLHFRKGIGCDFSKESIAKAKSIASETIFIICDVHHLPFKSKIFDTVSCLGSLEHYSDQTYALMELRRVLRRQGRLLISITNRNRWTRIFRFLSPGFKQPIEKPLSISDAMSILQGSGFMLKEIVNLHQFDFHIYCALPKWASIFLNRIDKFMPITSGIEPLYISQKV